MSQSSFCSLCQSVPPPEGGWSNPLYVITSQPIHPDTCRGRCCLHPGKTCNRSLSRSRRRKWPDIVAAFRSDVGPDRGVPQWDTDDGTIRNPGPPDGSKEASRGKGPKPSSHHLTFLTLFLTGNSHLLPEAWRKSVNFTTDVTSSTDPVGIGPGVTAPPATQSPDSPQSPQSYSSIDISLLGISSS